MASHAGSGMEAANHSPFGPSTAIAPVEERSPAGFEPRPFLAQRRTRFKLYRVDRLGHGGRTVQTPSDKHACARLFSARRGGSGKKHCDATGRYFSYIGSWRPSYPTAVAAYRQYSGLESSLRARKWCSMCVRLVSKRSRRGRSVR